MYEEGVRGSSGKIRRRKSRKRNRKKNSSDREAPGVRYVIVLGRAFF